MVTTIGEAAPALLTQASGARTPTARAQRQHAVDTFAPSRPTLHRMNSAPLLSAPVPPSATPLAVAPRPLNCGRSTISNAITSTMIKEVSWNHLPQTSALAVARSVPETVPMGLRITEHVLEPSDPHVAHCAARRAQASATWAETAGVIELGTAMMASFPLAPPFGLCAGFCASGLLRYRTVMPSQRSEHHILNIPFTTQAAEAMPAGSEIEVAGRGTLSGWMYTNTFIGQPIGPATLGAGISTVNTAGLAQEYSVTVHALDGHHKVRVTVQNINRESGGVTAKLLAGLNFGVGKLLPLNIAGGQLQYYINQNGYLFLESMVSVFTTAQLYAKADHSHTNTDMMVYDFDLSKPNAADAYEHLVRLSAGPAQHLATVTGSGVESANIEERNSTYTAETGLQVIGQKLLVRSALSDETQTRLTDAAGRQRITRQSVYSKHFSNFFKGSRDITWEMVSIKSSEESPSHPFCHFSYRKHSAFTDQSDITQFLNFVRSMGAQLVGTPQTHLNNLPVLEKIFSNGNRIHTDIDIYFTEAGLRNVVNVGEEAAVQAYMRSAIEIDPDLEGMPALNPQTSAGRNAREILDDYISVKSHLFFLNCCGNSELTGLEREYWVTTGRALKKDVKVFQQAKEFAKKIKELTDTTSAHQLSRFLKHIGSLTGFKYMPAISAITKIATHQETLVHQMAMSGGGISIICKNEGELMMPSEQLVRTLHAATLAI